MTRKRHDTMKGLPKPRLHDERDLRFSIYKSKATKVLDDIDLNACTGDENEFKRRTPKMLSSMARELYKHEQSRELFFSDEVTSEKKVNDYLIKAFQQEESRARNLLDFLVLSLKAQVEEYNTEFTTREHIKERIDAFLTLRMHKWMSVLTGKDLSEADVELRDHLIDKMVNLPEVCHECWKDMCDTKSMDIYCYFLRRLGIDEAGAEVKKIMDSLFFSDDLKASANEILDLISQKRRELGPARKVRDATKDDINVIVEMDAEPEPQPAEKELSPTTKKIINIGLSAATAVVLITSGILAYKNRKIEPPKKPKDPQAKNNPALNTVINMDAAVLPDDVKKANKDFKDAAVPPPIPVDASVKTVTPDASTPPPVPPNPNKTPPPVPGPNPLKVQADPHVKHISLMSVNDLPANYTDKYKSLFLGQKIDLKGQSMTEYIQSAIKEIATPNQWKKYNSFLKNKMEPGWLLYMAMQDDPWFEKTYKKKHRWQYWKAQRLLKKYNKLKDRLAKGKKLSGKQQRQFEDMESDLKVGKSIMLSLGKFTPGDVNDVESAWFSKDGKVAGIVIEIAKASGLQIPEIIVTDNNDFSNNETMLADAPMHETIELDEIDYEIIDVDNDNNPDTVQDTIASSANAVAVYNSHDPIKTGQDLLKAVEAKEKAKAIKDEERGQYLVSTVDNVLSRVVSNNEERGKHMESVVDRILGKMDVVEPPNNSPDYGYSGFTVEHPVEEPDPTVAVLDYDSITLEYDNDDYDAFEITEEKVA